MNTINTTLFFIYRSIRLPFRLLRAFGQYLIESIKRLDKPKMVQNLKYLALFALFAFPYSLIVPILRHTSELGLADSYLSIWYEMQGNWALYTALMLLDVLLLKLYFLAFRFNFNYQFRWFKYAKVPFAVPNDYNRIFKLKTVRYTSDL